MNLDNPNVPDGERSYFKTAVEHTFPMSHPLSLRSDSNLPLSRREWLSQLSLGLGSLAVSELAGRSTAFAEQGILQGTHHPARAKRIIYLFQSGAPSQIDLYDNKPLLRKQHGQELPDEIRRGQRLTTMTGSQSSFPLASSPFGFRQHGQSAAWVSELLPHTSAIADDLCFVKSMHTEAINHGPAVTYLQTGSQFPGRPSMGAWLHYGLGSETDELPAFVVLVTRNKGGQPLVSRLWGSAFLPSKYQGVRFRSGKDPVLYLGNPAGLDAGSRRKMLDSLRRLHELQLQRTQDPEIENRIAQYELAYRMQSSIPEAVHLADEPEHVFKEYGEDSRKPGTYAANCLLARRLAERGVRFIQLYHPGWDQHGNLPNALRGQCRETDRASAALVRDLKRRGLLQDTLVIWGGEFGRTNYCQGKLADNNFGRDHHPRCFSIWMAGGGIKSGTTYGSTDPFGYNVASDPVHVHDLHATILHLLGVDHERLTFKHQGRWYRLTDVHGSVLEKLVA